MATIRPRSRASPWTTSSRGSPRPSTPRTRRSCWSAIPMAGAMITQTAETLRRPDQEPGLSHRLPAAAGQTVEELARADGDSRLNGDIYLSEDEVTAHVKPEAVRGGFYGDCSDADAAFAAARLGPEAVAGVAHADAHQRGPVRAPAPDLYRMPEGPGDSRCPCSGGCRRRCPASGCSASIPIIRPFSPRPMRWPRPWDGSEPAPWPGTTRPAMSRGPLAEVRPWFPSSQAPSARAMSSRRTQALCRADGGEHPSRQGHAGDPSGDAPHSRRPQDRRAPAHHRQHREAFVESQRYNYLYQDGDHWVFMQPETFDQVHVGKDVVARWGPI